MSKRCHRTVGIKVFLTIYLLDERRIRILTSDLWIWIREAQKHVDTDPDTNFFHPRSRIRIK
jgi:hypothetical protein